MFGFFKPKANDIINTFQQQAFFAWRIQNAGVATTLRFKAALGIHTSILMSTMDQSRASVEKLSKEIFNEIIATTAGDWFKVSDIFSPSGKVRCINFSQEKFLVATG